MKHRVFNIGLFVIYIAGMTTLMIWQGIGIDPSRYAFVLLLASLLVRRTRSFILDWVPFLLILLFALKFFKYKALLFTPFVLAVWISIVYLGEHYVIDIIAGALYAIIFYFVAVRLHVVDWGRIIDKYIKKVES